MESSLGVPAKTLEGDGRRGMRLLGLFALWFVLAQLLFAAHAGDLPDHAPQSCEFCLAAAVSDDPTALEIELPAPSLSFGNVRQPVAADIVAEGALRAANPRGPPAH